MKSNEFEHTYGFSKAEWEACVRVLKILKDDPLHNPDNPFFGTIITKISKNAKKKRAGKAEKEKRRIEIVKESVIAKNALNGTTFYGLESEDHRPHFTVAERSKRCYSCMQPYRRIHSFYGRLCPDCAKLNFDNRAKRVDLTGRNIILTGGRVKVGFATALKLLRCGARLTITTRFPALAFEEFCKEKDYDHWKDRLTIYGLDLRRLHDVERFIQYYQENNEHLDVLINNAAQTIKYDDVYNQKLIQGERRLSQHIDGSKCLLNPGNEAEPRTEEKVLAISEEFNRFGQPIDLRPKNSWNSKLEEIDIVELLEVNLINQISPYLLIKSFRPMMKASKFKERFVVNVTSSEGQFSYTKKTVYHPHTNMTKEALNMLTLTSAKDLYEDGILMSAVDVGWISTGASEALRKQQFEKGYIPPLDPVDGAARILHPIYEKLINGVELYGALIKNYRIEEW